MERSFPCFAYAFNEIEELDLDMFEKNLAAQVAAGVQGVIIAAHSARPAQLAKKKKKSW
jgi:dihydrodipicolinate synthase/N-acetylneuraminate lyase